LKNGRNGWAKYTKLNNVSLQDKLQTLMMYVLRNTGTVIISLFLLGTAAMSQQVYQYSVDLTKVDNDQLTVNLITPKTTQKEIKFYLPKIVPGTYMNSNYGKYVHDLQAFDEVGKALPVNKYGDNGWTIKNAVQIIQA
jgi:hypothetical protein